MNINELMIPIQKLYNEMKIHKIAIFLRNAYNCDLHNYEYTLIEMNEYLCLLFMLT